MYKRTERQERVIWVHGICRLWTDFNYCELGHECVGEVRLVPTERGPVYSCWGCYEFHQHEINKHLGVAKQSIIDLEQVIGSFVPWEDAEVVATYPGNIKRFQMDARLGVGDV